MNDFYRFVCSHVKPKDNTRTRLSRKTMHVNVIDEQVRIQTAVDTDDVFQTKLFVNSIV